MKKIGIQLLFLFIVCGEVNASEIKDSSVRYSVQVARVSIIDINFDGYYFSCSDSSSWPMYDLNPYTTWGMAASRSTKHKLGIPFRLSHNLGFQYSKQDYTRNYGTGYRMEHGLKVCNPPIEDKAQVIRYQAVYRLEAKVGLMNLFVFGPLVQIDAQVATKLSGPLWVLEDFGVLSPQNKLRNHARFNVKCGGQLALQLTKQLQLGVNLMYGIGNSIKPNYGGNWRAAQGGLFLNIRVSGG